MRERIRGVLEFYVTIGVPLLYAVNLWLIAVKGGVNFGIVPRLIGAFLTVGGLFLWTLSYINLGRAFGVLPKKQKRVKKGVYRLFRHPMYWGIVATFGGLSLVNGSMAGIIYLGLVLIPLLWVRAKLEERVLSE